MTLSDLIARVDDQRVPGPFRARIVAELRSVYAGSGPDYAERWLQRALAAAPGRRLPFTSDRSRAAANSPLSDGRKRP